MAVQTRSRCPVTAFNTGQAVVYRAGGDQAVGGLTSNQVYYAIADPNNADTFKLAATLEHAFAGQAIDLQHQRWAASIRSPMCWVTATSPI